VRARRRGLHGVVREADESRGGVSCLLIEPRAVERGGAEEFGAGGAIRTPDEHVGRCPEDRVEQIVLKCETDSPGNSLAIRVEFALQQVLTNHSMVRSP